MEVSFSFDSVMKVFQSYTAGPELSFFDTQQWVWNVNKTAYPGARLDTSRHTKDFKVQRKSKEF